MSHSRKWVAMGIQRVLVLSYLCCEYKVKQAFNKMGCFEHWKQSQLKKVTSNMYDRSNFIAKIAEVILL